MDQQDVRICTDDCDSILVYRKLLSSPSDKSIDVWLVYYMFIPHLDPRSDFVNISNIYILKF